MASNKNILYKKEVSTVTVQETHLFTNPAKANSDNRFVFEEDTLSQASSYFEGKTSKCDLTNEIVTSKENLCTERNNNRVEHSCDICGIICTGIENLKLHILGKKHIKKLKEQEIFHRIRSTTRHIEIPTTINCDVCEKQFAKLDDYLLHCKGEVHQEILSLNIPMKANKLKDLSHHSEAVRCTKSPPFKYCDVCKIVFIRPMDYDLHLETRENCRKFQNKDILISSSEGNVFTCETCDKSFSGLESYRQHLMSDSHSKKDAVAKIMNMNPKLHCKDCGKKFSGIIPFNEHMIGPSHKRQIEKNNFLKNMDEEHLEVLDHSMFGIRGEDTKIGGNVKPDRETCHSEFKKYEGVRDHRSGVKHQVTKEEFLVEKLQEFTIEEGSLVKENAARLPENNWDDPLIEL